MERRPLLLALTALLLLACACGSTRSGGGAAAGEPGSAEVAAAAGLEMIDPRRGEERGAGFLEVTLRNVSGASLRVRCAPEWLDARGALLESASAWRSVELAPGAEQRVRFAPAPAAAPQWRLRFAG